MEPRLPTTSSSSSPASPTSPTLTIRFTNSLPDLLLPLPSPSTITPADIQSTIRHDRPSLASHHLRLIHAGHPLLPSTSPLSSFLPLNQQNIFIHCSPGTLITEAAPDESAPHLPAPSRPLGFDRLLTAGFTETEVAALRAEFTRLNPEAQGEELRALEERWIDESGEGEMGAGVGGGGSGYVDMFAGTVIGFFWPAVAVCWVLREEGLVLGRRGMAVVAGVGVNLLFGLVRVWG